MNTLLWISMFCAALSMTAAQDNGSTGPSLAFWKRVSTMNIKSAEDFIRELVRKDPASREESDLFDENGIPNERALGAAHGINIPDACEPKISSVVVEADPDPMVTLWPMCVHLHRCGGCCGHSALKCFAIEQHPVRVMLLRASFQSNTDYFNPPIPIQRDMMNHTRCACGCATKAHHCNQNQTYVEPDCRCKCRNEHTEMPKCNALQRWDADICQCMCMRVTNCEAGLYFNTATCQCELPSRARETVISTGGNGSQRPDISQPSDPCASTRCGTSYKKQRVGSRCRCVYDLFGRRR